MLFLGCVGKGNEAGIGHPAEGQGISSGVEPDQASLKGKEGGLWKSVIFHQDKEAVSALLILPKLWAVSGQGVRLGGFSWHGRLADCA